MKRTRLYTALMVMILLVLLLPVSAAARMDGDAFAIYGDLPRTTWRGGVAYEPLSGDYAVGLQLQEYTGGPLRPYVEWYDSSLGYWLGLDRIALTNVDATPPDIACGGTGLGICLATWVSDGTAYYRWIASDTNLWTDIQTLWLMNNAEAVSTKAAAILIDAYVIAVETTDQTIQLIVISPAGLTWNHLAQHPAGCTAMQYPRLADSADGSHFGLAFSCTNNNKVYAQIWTYTYPGALTHHWTENPSPSGGTGYNADIAADDNGNFLIVWASEFSNPRILGQGYTTGGVKLGAAFNILPDAYTQAAPSVAPNHAQDEFLVVFEQQGDILYRRVEAGGALKGAPYVVTQAEGTQSAPAAIYGAVNNRYLVAWTHRVGGETVWARWVDPEPILGGDAPLSNEIPDAPGTWTYYQAPAMPNTWQAIGMRPGPADDFDVYLTANQGYGIILASSIMGMGAVDLVMMDGRQAAHDAYYPYISYFNGSAAPRYVVEYGAGAGQITRDNPTLNLNMDAEAVIKVFEIAAQAGQTLDIQVGPSGIDLGMALFDPGLGAHQCLADAVNLSDSGGQGQPEVLSYNPPSTGWYALVVWKNDENAGTAQVEVVGAAQIDYAIFIPLVLKN